MDEERLDYSVAEDTTSDSSDQEDPAGPAQTGILSRVQPVISTEGLNSSVGNPWLFTPGPELPNAHLIPPPLPSPVHIEDPRTGQPEISWEWGNRDVRIENNFMDQTFPLWKAPDFPTNVSSIFDNPPFARRGNDFLDQTFPLWEANDLSDVSTDDDHKDHVLCSVEDCGVVFTGKYQHGNLARHIRCKHIDRMYPCEICKKSFRRKDKRREHQRRKHPPESVHDTILTGNEKSNALHPPFKEDNRGRSPSSNASRTRNQAHSPDVARMAKTVPHGVDEAIMGSAEQYTVQEHHQHEQEISLARQEDFEQRLKMHQDTWSRQRIAAQRRATTESDNESDGSSITSRVESIFSIASLSSIATELSAASGYSTAQIETATKELLQIFLENETLVNLYRVAIQRADIGSERLHKNIRRLLKAFARDLQTEANKDLERLAARLVSLKASYVAQSIIEKFEVKQTVGSASPRHRDEISDEEDAEEGTQDEPVDEDLIEDLLEFNKFLVGGDAFVKFRKHLAAFVLPRSEVHASNTAGEIRTNQCTLRDNEDGSPKRDEKKDQRIQQDRSISWRSQRGLASVFITAGFLEPPLDSGWVRLRWQCRCGENFFGDVKEYRAGGVKELTEKMSRSTGARVTVTPYDKSTTNQNWTFTAPAWARRLTNSSSSSRTRALSTTGCLPQHNGSHDLTNQSNPITASAPATPIKPSSAPKLHLLACAHRTQRRKCLLQDPVDMVSTDRALFCFMKQQLKRNCSVLRSILSMRSVQGMFFVKFRLRMGNTVEVRDHNPCCMSSQSASCECIPPSPKVEPSPNAEYRCTPAGPLATWPPVLSQDLMHMLCSPQCIDERETWVLDQLPKRTRGELEERAGQPVEGWGIYYQEGVDFDMIIGVVFCIFVLASFLFGILWTVFEHDVQGAFGISSYMVTASGIFLAWMASRAKN